MRGKVAVVGSVVLDEIERGGKAFTSFGGITYSILALAALLPDREIIPITYVGEGDLDRFRELTESFPNINLEAVKICSRGTNRNRLIYGDGEERDEFFELITPPLTFRDLMPYLESDAFLVNYIKNDDLSFQDLKTLSYAFKGVLYMDIHSLLRERNADGGFRLKKLRDWQSWARMADILQMNRLEIQHFTGFKTDTEEELEKLALLVVSQGPKALNLTLGSRGSILAYRKENSAFVKRFRVPAVKVVDPTGCGDIFGASFLADYLKHGDFERAASFANEMASRSVSYPGLEFIVSTGRHGRETPFSSSL
ncbi:MAG: carbohydrate kinase family protein [Candidatus Hydrothermae bacterium]|nr:carbohydrate kinase family protein [Candidatus Hydrothermae bacterium]